MNGWLIFSTVIAVALVVVLVAVIAYNNKNKSQEAEPDYRTFFILGITFLPVGIATKNPGLWGMGAVFMIFGLANRNKWKEEPAWSEQSPESKRFKSAIIIGLIVLLLVSILVYIIAK